MQSESTQRELCESLQIALTDSIVTGKATFEKLQQAHALLEECRVALEYAQEGLYVFKGPGETGIPKIQAALDHLKSLDKEGSK